ncbi:hypothetical protein Lpp124_08438 [Lacticaseibacillus paracasei subsp. paracasei CNCM I-4649]|nr:hypothetical protein Lpp124_08438 [Lacticaseibacillus paracasei subsp. paracasei CNCM I-4649]
MNKEVLKLQSLEARGDTRFHYYLLLPDSFVTGSSTRSRSNAIERRNSNEYEGTQIARHETRDFY